VLTVSLAHPMTSFAASDAFDISYDAHTIGQNADYSTARSTGTSVSTSATQNNAANNWNEGISQFQVTRFHGCIPYSLPDGAQIAAASLYFYPNSKLDNRAVDPSLTMVESSRADCEAVSSSDHPLVGSTSMGSISLSSIVTNSFNEI